MDKRKMVQVCPSLYKLTIFVSFGIAPGDTMAVEVTYGHIDTVTGDTGWDVKGDRRRVCM